MKDSLELERVVAASRHPDTCANLATRSRHCSGNFARDEQGSIGIFFAVTFLVVMLIVALAVDYGRADLEHQRLQRAADAAALAASHRLGLPDQDESGAAIAQLYFKANTAGSNTNDVKSIKLDAAKGEVRIESGKSVFTSLLNAIGINSMDVQAGSRVVKGDGTVEIALVLDNSGSMAGQPIEDLRAAASHLAKVVFTGADQSDRVKIGIVPFSGAVNVGAGNRASNWMDQAGVSPLNGVNFDANTPRFGVFEKLGVAWKGCVEARPAPYDTTDDAASDANPETLFVPMFAPDEPDSANADGDNYSNNYIADDGGACTPQPKTCLSYSRRGKCTNWSTEPLPAATAQARLCKYTSASVGNTAGPNYMCDSTPILPLTGNKADIDAKLATMVASGYTNIPEGLMWGWRVLSPESPFTEGRSYASAGNRKILVLMTDGANTYPDANNHNKSRYGAQGYGALGRLGTDYRSSGYVSEMNEKMLTACTNAKAQGIKVYTVAFRLDSDPAAKALLESCATEATTSFSAANGTALISVFERIGAELSKLRVAG